MNYAIVSKIHWNLIGILHIQFNALPILKRYKYLEDISKKEINMKKGIIIAISTALTVFLLAALFFTVRIVGAFQTYDFTGQSAINTTSASGISEQKNAAAAITSTSTKIDQVTAVSLAKMNGGLAVITDSNPSLVDLNGTVAYEVNFDTGKIYIDANSGNILGDTIRITPELAGQAAAAFLQTSRFSRVDVVARNGANVYRVYFNQGILVYINFKGQVVSWEYTQPVYSNPSRSPSANSNSSHEEDD